MLQKQAEHEARALGWNAHFEEFVPVRYAVQMASGAHYFIKVRVQPELFIDMSVSTGVYPDDGKLTVDKVQVDVDEATPIFDSKAPPAQPEEEDCDGCKSEERLP